MKKTLIMSLFLTLVFTLNLTSVSANTSGNESYYVEAQLSELLESQVSYEGIYPNTFTFPDVTSRIKNDIALGWFNQTCHVWFDMDDFYSFDTNNFERIDNQNIKFIGEDDTISYTILVIGEIDMGADAGCLGGETFQNQIIALKLQPDISNFFESCSTFDVSCQAGVISKGIGQLPDLAENANETMDHVDTLAGGFPAMQFGLALFFIAMILAFKKWFS